MPAPPGHPLLPHACDVVLQLLKDAQNYVGFSNFDPCSAFGGVAITGRKTHSNFAECNKKYPEHNVCHGMERVDNLSD